MIVSKKDDKRQLEFYWGLLLRRMAKLARGCQRKEKVLLEKTIGKFFKLKPREFIGVGDPTILDD